MKKRIASFLLAIIILLSVGSVCIVEAHAESAFVASDDCIRVLKAEEGFSRKPYWDYSQYTVGYGTSCPSDMVEYYTQNGITEEEAEQLLRNSLTRIENDINKRIVDKYQLTLTQNQFDALVLFSFNCGTGWAYSPSGVFHSAIANSATGNDLIRAFALWCSAGNQIQTFLLRRRLSEANMYLNGVYAQIPPENYCYVLYDANGGTTSPRSQGYDSALTAEPFPVPTRVGYNFIGWFTSKTGGTQVTVLDASTKSKTLYAHWEDAEGNVPNENETSPANPATVTVTATDVRFRNGPGTNYTVVGTAEKGQKVVITETASGSGYVWGKCDSGWIALEFTDYDTVINQKPEATEPPATEPPATEPPATEPPATEPPATEPPATEPPTTEPPVTPEKPKTQTGTINVKEWLRVRSGPGTSYSIVEYLKPQQKVEILELKMVGTQQWGKISNGWISMDYVILDKTAEEEDSGNTSSGEVWTGKVVNANELRIRSGAGTNYSIVGYLKGGTKVTITEKKTNGSMVWGKISNGWISLDYVQLDVQSTDKTPDTETKIVTGTVNVQDFLRVRNGPSTSYAINGYLKPKEKVTITEQRTVGSTVWGKIESGWISLNYVILDTKTETPEDNKGENTPTTPETPAVTVTKTVTADCLRVRSGPGTNNTIVGYLYYGAKVEILETANAADGNLWGKIKTGWISMDYVK